jgi:cell wall-associated NlpC family hydrolase
MTAERRKAIRTIIRRYLERAENNQPDIHYDQMRRLTSLGDPPMSEYTTDCSGLCISAFYWADLWLPYKVKDPSGYNYLGWGNTGSILSTNRKRRVPLDRKFFVGDMALFGSWSNTKHVTICRRNGNMMTSIWTSHGSELGPYATRLKYRTDFLCVVRAESLA